MLTYREACTKVSTIIGERAPRPAIETVALASGLGRILAEEVRADREYPPFPRSTRDGFAVRSADIATVPVTLRRIGEVKAGEAFSGKVGPGECVQIMTGAPAPAGADAVVMVEDTQIKGDQVVIRRSLAAGANIVPQGSEAAAGRCCSSRNAHRLHRGLRARSGGAHESARLPPAAGGSAFHWR
jgi:molybdopterin molybdotransferase